MIPRRHLLGAAVACAALPASGLFAAESSYDLVIRGGRVVDPSQRIDRIADVAIQDGKIAAIAPNLPANAAPESIDAKGLLVVPGLIDIHVHARDAELPPSEILASGGVTTMVDAGSRGADNIDSILSIARAAPNRLRLLLNIALLGNFRGASGNRAEFLDGIAPADVGRAREAVEEHRDWIVGIKARLSRGVSPGIDKEVLRRAIQAAEPSGKPVMIHVGDTSSPLGELVEMLRPGDIVTHMYVPTNGILDASGKLLPEVLRARENGIRFDFGNGLNEHWNWETAEKALAQGFLPDTLSSDLNVPGRTAQVFDFPNVLSKFLALGLSLDEVLTRVTLNSAQTFREFNQLGSLRTGATADITLLELRDGDFEFVDNYRGVRKGRQKLLTRGVVVDGIRFA